MVAAAVSCGGVPLAHLRLKLSGTMAPLNLPTSPFSQRQLEQLSLGSCSPGVSPLAARLTMAAIVA